ncbi:MAG TPA: sulfite exporter TauE/SafE family protein [Gemmatimonadales bacterium]|nr:sulfite exporter TauE/SafE family protein [Gemmatimonadales bacterium]
MGELVAGFGAGLVVGVVSAVVGIGGGVVMVPLLYLVYSHTPTSLGAQTVVAHATSLGVAFVTSTIGTWRYARRRAIVWPPALVYGLAGAASAFVTARILTRMDELRWVRGAFGLFLMLSAIDMARRALGREPHEADPRAPAHPVLLVVAGLASGVLASLLGIGGGLVAVPVMLYCAKLPIKAVAPTTLAAVVLTTLSGVLGYLTASGGPPVSRTMVGFVDLRMAVPLALGAALTVPLGVYINRTAHPRTLFWSFGAVLGLIGARLAWQGFAG